MSVFLILGGILAALILFRWARTLAMIGLLVLVLAFCSETHAQGMPLVQCQVGQRQFVVTDPVCLTLQRARREASIDVRAHNFELNHGQPTSIDYMSPCLATLGITPATRLAAGVQNYMWASGFCGDILTEIFQLKS